jgi:SAM-dependent methyltransferase
MKRIVRPEILDSNQCDPRDVRDSLVDLQRINRWFGGIHTSSRMIDTVLGRTGAKTLTLLDIASATGDIPEHIKLRLASRSVQFSYTLLDRDTSHFDGVRAPRVRGDALSLPFRNNSFDVVTCSLFAHHLEPAELVAFARESLRVAKVALLINDLRRSYMHLAAIYAGLPLFRRITRHDSVASVWRSYTIPELRQLLRLGSETAIQRSYLFRMGAIVWK